LKASSRGRKLRKPLDPTRYTPFFARRGGSVYCEGVPLARVAEKAGTPAYVYSRKSLEAAYRQLHAVFAAVPHTICYAVKANANLSILRLLARLGSSFDIVSGGELYRLRSIGVPGRRMVFSGVGKTAAEIREALRAAVRLLNVESEAELELVAQEAARLRTPVPAAIRVNPDVATSTHPHIATGRHQHKFGVDWLDARRLYLKYRGHRWIHWQGISAHIGSQILDLGPFRRAVVRLAGYVRDLAGQGIPLRHFDFGGGIGVRYSDEKPLDLRGYARVIRESISPLGCHLLLEPGRMLVGPAGVLLTRVLYVKRSRGKTFVIVDAAMNDFMRPALYGAIHPITKAETRNSKSEKRKAKSETRLRTRMGAEFRVSDFEFRPSTIGADQRADIVGPVCETGDAFLHDWPIGNVQAGDLLVIWGTGAYGFVSTTNYNSRPRPPEVLVKGRRFRPIRRRESRADLTRLE
jgi:diaminopimelate decarboxylase